MDQNDKDRDVAATQNLKPRSRMDHPIVERILRPLLGWLFIFLGVIGLFLPLLQGVLFLVIGLTLLSNRYVFAKRLLDKARARFPSEYAKVEATHDRVLASKALLTTAIVFLVFLLAIGFYLLSLGVRELMAMV